MKQLHKQLALLLAGAMALGCLAGCGSAASDPNASSAASPASAGSSEATSNSDALEPLQADADGNVTITDMAGRIVTFPQNPTVWNSSPTAEGWLCAIAPEQIIGWASGFNEQQLGYWPASVAGLETLGGNFGTSEANIEAIIAAGPDIIVNTFDLSTDAAIAVATASAEEMSAQYGIPVVCLSRDIRDTPEVASLLGLWLGQPERGAQVAAYLQGLMDKIDATVAAVPADEVVTYYYAEGMDGLSTESKDSFHADVYTYCGLNAAVGDDVTLSNFGGMEAVSLEQVLGWDPEYIFVWNPQAYQSILADPSWADITAVKEGHVYLNPTLPQNWVDRSPNSLRVLGCLFTAAVCYPDYCTYDLDEEVKEFFQFMYGVSLTEEQLRALY